MRLIRGVFALAVSVAGIGVFSSATTRAAPADPIVLAAGDIADCNSSGDSATAALLDAHPQGIVLTLGDNAYENGTALEFAHCYEPTWGRHKSRTLPAPGNHEYSTPNAAGYFGYFGSAAGPDTRGYYSFDVGSWHVVSLNSERDTGVTGAQVAWLRADLAATSVDCVLAYWHRPRWTGGNYADDSTMQHLWDVLYDAGADVVLAGHDHNYQRYPPLDKIGAPDPVRGIRSFVVGTGGRHLYPLRADSRREAGTDATWGVLQLTLHPASYSWRFLPVAGSTYADSGSGACSPAADPVSPPSTPPSPPPPASSPPPSSPQLSPSPISPPHVHPAPIAPPASGSSPQPTPAPPAADSTVAPPSSPPPAEAWPPPPKPEPPTLKIGRGPLRVSASGRGRIWLGCPKRGPRCVARLAIRPSDRRVLPAFPRRARSVVASGTYVVRAGSARPIRVDLSRRGLRVLRRYGAMRGRLVASPVRGGRAVIRSVRIVLVKSERS